MLICTAMLSLAGAPQGGLAPDVQTSLEPVTGHRFLTLATVVRVDQIEVTRDLSHGPDESAIHGPEEARVFREAIAESSTKNCSRPSVGTEEKASTGLGVAPG